MGKLADKLASGQKVITAEIAPPKGAGIKKLLEHAALIGPNVDAINITDCQRALVRMSSLAASKVLLDAGYEPVLQLTCRDRNTIALQSDLMGAGALGIPNLLCLTGDPVKAGDCTQAKPVFEVESVRELEIVQKLQNGTDWNGHKMNKKTKFLVGAVVNPCNQSLGGQLSRMEKKIEAGAQFFQTQANYDLEDFRKFVVEAKARFNTKILAGVLLLHSAEVARYIHDNIPGIRIPDSVLAGFESAPNAEEYGIDFAVRTMLALEDVCDGFHLMTIRTEELLPKMWSAYRTASSRGHGSSAETTDRKVKGLPS
jgi:methylenetetrahydrofolate reductase (NADPH)